MRFCKSVLEHFWLSLSLLAGIPPAGHAQTYFIAGNNPAFDPYTAIPCALGDGFVARGETNHVRVRLIGNDAGATGVLYFVDPRKAPNPAQDQRLFSNKDNAMIGVNIDLGLFPKGSPIIFKYITEEEPPKYSGQNDSGSYNFDNDPVLGPLPINHTPKPVSPELNNFGDHRWAISGRVNATEVVFAVDDMAGGDYDYNDVVFVVTGVALNSEVKLAKPAITGVGNFNPDVQVSIAAPAGAVPPLVIYYTRDGSDPRVDSLGRPQGTTLIFNGAFAITDSATIIARVWKPAETDSGGGVKSYLPSDTAMAVFRPTLASVTGSVYLDEDGDGHIDAARIVFNIRPTPPPAQVALTSPFPPGAAVTLPGAQLQPSPRPADTAVLFARFPAQRFGFGTGFAPGPFGRFPSGPIRYGAQSFVIGDSAGPVIVRADALKDAANPASHLVRVVFSEPMQVNTATPSFPFLLKRANPPDPNGQMNVSAVRRIDDTTYEYVFTPASPYYPIPGDSIKLVSHAAALDARGNSSNMSYFIPVTGPMESVQATVVAAVYLDENGDGRIDAARLQFDRKPPAPPAEITLLDPFPPGETVTLPAARIERLPAPADSAVLMARFPDLDFSFGTGFAEGPFGRFPTAPLILYRPEAYGLIFAPNPFPIGDAVGPVAIKAESMRDPANPAARLLRVVFSENMQVDAAARALPFLIKRMTGADPNGQMNVAEVRKIGESAFEYVFVPNSGYYPVPGDSLKLLPHAAALDTRANLSNMSYFIPVGGPVDTLHVDIVAKGGGFVVGSDIINPIPLGIPISLVAGGAPITVPICLDCRDPGWKGKDPARPNSFPLGPSISISTKSPFSFDLTWFSHIGEYVNHAAAEVTEAMLKDAPLDSAGNRLVSLMWYPVGENGRQAGTGVYIAKGIISVATVRRQGPQGENISVYGSSRAITLQLGYVRK